MDLEISHEYCARESDIHAAAGGSSTDNKANVLNVSEKSANVCRPCEYAHKESWSKDNQNSRS